MTSNRYTHWDLVGSLAFVVCSGCSPAVTTQPPRSNVDIALDSADGGASLGTESATGGSALSERSDAEVSEASIEMWVQRGLAGAHIAGPFTVVATLDVDGDGQRDVVLRRDEAHGCVLVRGPEGHPRVDAVDLPDTRARQSCEIPAENRNGAWLVLNGTTYEMAGPIHSHGALGPPVPIPHHALSVFSVRTGHPPTPVLADEWGNVENPTWTFETLGDGSVRVNRVLGPMPPGFELPDRFAVFAKGTEDEWKQVSCWETARRSTSPVLTRCAVQVPVGAQWRVLETDTSGSPSSAAIAGTVLYRGQTHAGTTSVCVSSPQGDTRWVDLPAAALSTCRP